MDNGCVACLAGCGDGDAFDEISHCHFNVKFDKVSEGMELDVANGVRDEGLQVAWMGCLHK